MTAFRSYIKFGERACHRLLYHTGLDRALYFGYKPKFNLNHKIPIKNQS